MLSWLPGSRRRRGKKGPLPRGLHPAGFRSGFFQPADQDLQLSESKSSVFKRRRSGPASSAPESFPARVSQVWQLQDASSEEGGSGQDSRKPPRRSSVRAAPSEEQKLSRRRTCLCVAQSLCFPFVPPQPCFLLIRKSCRPPAPPALAKMLILLAFIILFHITSAALLFISTIDDAWWVGDGFFTDIWHQCINGTNCTSLDSALPEYPSIQTVQATMVLSTILCCVAFFVFILQLFRLKQGERFVLTSIIQLLSCLCVMIGASVYTDRRAELHQGAGYGHFAVESGRFGYSYVLAWVAFAFTLLSGLMYLVLRKRK